ncbi:FUCL1-like protein, partial [Mya arenaria]
TYNVAFGKTASQSSNFNTSKYLAPTAVDGNVGNNAMASGSCFHTTREYQPWWRVDLLQDYYITTERARNIKLTIGKSLDSMSQAGYLDGGLTTTHTFTVDPPLAGRFVQMQLQGITECFHLCEVEVMAYPSGTRARNITLTIGKSLDSMSKAGYLDGGLTTHTFTVDPSLVGRFVQLQLKEITEFFHLCEVEVMAYPSGEYITL